jgi:Ca-activated chloride channel family protein
MGGKLLVLTVVALLAAAPIHSQAQSPRFKTGTELVGLSVAVTDAQAQPVPGLTADQFQVFEDGIAQDVKFFAPGELPLDVVILLDTSASMASSMPLVKQAATRFARALRPGDRASVMGISNGLRVLQAFTPAISDVEQAIQKTVPGGKTPLYAAIYTALNELEKLSRSVTEPRRQSIVVLSDGQDTSSAFAFDDLLSIVRHHAVPIYTIAPRAAKSVQALREQVFGESTMSADFELRKLADETGGRAFFPVTTFELAGVYDTIATELAHQYALGYESNNRARDGAFRRISLRIVVPGLKWRTRAGYVADRVAAAGEDR